MSNNLTLQQVPEGLAPLLRMLVKLTWKWEMIILFWPPTCVLLLPGNDDGCSSCFSVPLQRHVQSEQVLGVLQVPDVDEINVLSQLHPG